MAEEVQTEVPVQAAEEQPVSEVPVVQELQDQATAEPAVETAEPVVEVNAEAEQGDTGLKRSRDEEDGADGEEPEAKRAAPEMVENVRFTDCTSLLPRGVSHDTSAPTGGWRCRSSNRGCVCSNGPIRCPSCCS